MSRSVEDRIQDILQAVTRCERYVELLDVHRADPDLVTMAEDAIERNLQVIGGAASHLPSA